MGIFGTQLEDGTIPLSKLDAALQALQVPSPFKNGTGTNSVFGPGAADPTFADSFASGTGTSISGVRGFASGSGMQAGQNCFSHGYAYGGFNGATGYASFASGAGVRAAGYYCFAQGAFYIDLRGDGIFGQGSRIYQTNTSARSVFIQGDQITLSGDCKATFVQGENITNSNAVTRAFAQGGLLTWGPGVGDIFMQGYYMDCLSRFCFMQGGQISYGNRIYAGCEDSFTQGRSIYIEAGSTQAFGQGFNLNIYNSADSVFLQGSGIGVGGFASFAQGQGNVIRAGSDISFIQGRSCEVVGKRAFVRGNRAKALRDDQTSWGSNRSAAIPPIGAAQTSWIVKHVQTTDAIQTTLLTFDLEQDQAYSIRIKLIARNTITDDEVASFVLPQALAYRDTAGVAVLVNSPVALTRLDSGGGTIVWLADIVQSGNDVLLRVTGDALDTVEWCCDFEFVEVRG